MASLFYAKGEGRNSTETSACFHRIPRRHILADGKLHNDCHDNLKYYITTIEIFYSLDLIRPQKVQKIT
jgi:hypothetical protein